MYLKKFYFILLILIFSSSLVFSQKKLSFTQARELMYENNNLIKSTQKKYESQYYSYKSTQGYYFPKLDFEVTGLYLDKAYGYDFTGEKNDIMGSSPIFGLFPFVFPNLNNTIDGKLKKTLISRAQLFGNLKLTMPIYTGGKITSAVRANRIKTDIAQQDLKSVKNKLYSELVERYFKVLLAQEALKVRKDVFDGIKKHLEAAIKLEKKGMIASVQRMSADVAMSDADAELLAAKSDVELARIALANTLNIDKVDEELNTSFIDYNKILLPPISYFKEKSIENYPEYKKILLTKDLAEQGKKINISSYLPTIGAFGFLNLFNNHGIKLGNSDERHWLVGLSLNYNIFEGGSTLNEVRSSEAMVQGVELYRQKVEKDINTLIEKLYSDIKKQKELLHTFDVRIAQAKELVRVRELSFTEGFSTSTDVIDSRLNLSAIELKKLKLNYDYIESLTTLFEYSGMSNELNKYIE